MHKRVKGYEEQVHLLGSPKALMRSCILRDNKHCRILKKEITLYSYYLHVQALCEVLLRYILSLNPPCSPLPQHFTDEGSGTPKGAGPNTRAMDLLVDLSELL